MKRKLPEETSRHLIFSVTLAETQSLPPEAPFCSRAKTSFPENYIAVPGYYYTSINLQAMRRTPSNQPRGDIFKPVVAGRHDADHPMKRLFKTTFSAREDYRRTTNIHLKFSTKLLLTLHLQLVRSRLMTSMLAVAMRFPCVSALFGRSMNCAIDLLKSGFFHVSASVSPP